MEENKIMCQKTKRCCKQGSSKTTAIILTAGKGERMQPLSLGKPKHLLCVLGKSIIEHNLDQLNGLVSEVVLVVRPDGICKAIKQAIGNNYKNLKIRYAIQKKALGTGDAAKSTLSFVNDKFLLLNGDDLYCRKDIQEVLKNFPCLLAKEVAQPQFFGIIEHRDGVVNSLVEKPDKPNSNLANTGLYFLSKEIFNFSIRKSPRGEYELTDYIKQFIKKNKLYLIEAERWTPVSFPWNLLEVSRVLFEQIKGKNLAKVKKNCNISGKVRIGEGTIIKSGVSIEGPVYIGKNCVLGPNCFLRGVVSMGDNCRVGQSVEIKNSIIGDNTSIAHLSYVGDSIVGENCNLGAGTIVANVRHDRGVIETKIRGILVSTGRRKFGAILGDGVKTGIGTLIYPGRKIWPGKTTLPGEKVVRDIS